MTKIKKLTSVVLAAAMCLSLTVPAMAAEGTQPQPSMTPITSTNEYDLIQELQQTSDTVLLESGYTASDIEELRALDFEQECLDIAKLPEEDLQARGYDKDTIVLIKEYENAEEMPENVMRAIAGTLTADITCSVHTLTQFTFQYGWEWDHQPINEFKDSVGLSWEVYNTSVGNIDYDCSDQKMVVDYYLGVTYRYSQTTKDFDVLSSNHFLSGKFPMLALDNSVWAKSGYITTTVKKRTNALAHNLSYVQASAAYGHTLLSITVEPKLDAYNNITFSGVLNTNLQRLEPRKYRLYISGNKDVISSTEAF